jgi:PAS domain S-box-containing protein
MHGDPAPPGVTAASHACEDRMRLALETSGVYAWEWDPATDAIWRSPNAPEVLGISSDRLAAERSGFRAIYHPDDLASVEAALDTALKTGGAFRIEARVLGDDGVPRWIEERGRVLPDSNGHGVRVVGVTADIAERRALLVQSQTLLREVHHRVKNNLQVVSSLLSLQARAVGPQLLAHFQDSIARVRAMGRVHDQLYSSGNLVEIEFLTYLRMLVADLSNTYGAAARIRTQLDVPTIAFDLDTATPLGLLLSEVISNAYKHGFPEDRRGEIVVSLTETEDRVTVHVRDNGIGLPAGGAGPRAGSIGMTLIEALAQQLNATYRYEGEGGTVFAVEFPRKAPRSVTKGPAV